MACCSKWSKCNGCKNPEIKGDCYSVTWPEDFHPVIVHGSILFEDEATFPYDPGIVGDKERAYKEAEAYIDTLCS